MIKIRSKNSLYPQAFYQTPGGQVQEITVGEQFEPRTLESFDPATQERYRGLPAMIHTQLKLRPSLRFNLGQLRLNRTQPATELRHNAKQMMNHRGH
jgi:hypothetical protein